VAGIVGGLTYGVAKNVELIAVKALDCNGDGNTQTVINGIEWVKQNAQANGKKATVNLSLNGAGVSAALDFAVNQLQESGVVTVVSAGNDNKNACSQSPGREPSVITVGSTRSNDEKSGFSNFGSCLDIFAPGSDI